MNLVGADGGGLFLEDPQTGEWISSGIVGHEIFSFAPVDPVVEKINQSCGSALIPLSDEDRQRLDFSPSVTLACGCSLSLEESRRAGFCGVGDEGGHAEETPKRRCRFSVVIWPRL